MGEIADDRIGLRQAPAVRELDHRHLSHRALAQEIRCPAFVLHDVDIDPPIGLFEKVGGDADLLAIAGTPVAIKSHLGSPLHADGHAIAGRLLLFELAQGSRILDRHDLHEFGQIVGPMVDDLAGPVRTRIFQMAAEQMPDALTIVAIHMGGHIDEAMMLEIAAMMMQALDRFLLGRHRRQIDHREIAALGEIAALIENIGDTARHAGGEVASGFADDKNDAAGHVFAAMIANTFDDGDGAGIPHRETLTGDAAQIAFTAYRAIKHGIADDDRLFRDEAYALMRLDD